VFDTEREARAWEKQQKAKVTLGQHVDPAAEKMTVAAWSQTWLESYSGNRERTVRQAKIHIALINEEFARKPIRSIKPIHVQTWTAKLKAQGYEDSTVYAVYRRLAQILASAVQNDVLDKNPCSRQIAPRAGRQKVYVATRAQVDAVYAAFPEHLRPAILLGAFAGLRTAEAVGLRQRHVDFLRLYINPVEQLHRHSDGAEELKSETSGTSIPIPEGLALDLSAAIARWGGDYVVTDGLGGPASTWAIDRAMRRVRKTVSGLPETFVFHDLRHFFASSLIEAGFDVKRVQALLRHASAKTTLDTYGHLFPNQDDAVRVKLGTLYASQPEADGPVTLQRGTG
jgi:integrase